MRRLLPVLLAAALVLSGCGDDRGTAARIGGSEISFDDLEAQAEAWVANPDFLQALTGSIPPDAGQGRLDQQVVLAILGIRVQSVAAGELLAESDSEVPGELVEGLRGEIQALAPDFDDAVLDDAVSLIAPVIFLSQNGVPFQPLPADEVYISPRLGSYDVGTGTVLAPEGPAPNPGALDLEL